MGKNRKKVYVVAVLLLLTTIYIIPASKANTETLTAKEKLPAFLNEVVGIDMPNYNKTNEGYSASYPSTYGGVVKRENYGFVLVSNGSILDVVSIFDNGQIYGIVIHPRNNSVIYSQEPSSNLLDCARNILEKYQIFVQKYGIGTSHVIQAADMLNDVTDLKNSVITRGNTTQEISTSISTSTDFTERHINIAWTYSAEGVDVDNKCLRIDFDDNDITFRDTWNLFTVGTF